MNARLFRPQLEALEDRLTPTLTYHGGAILPNVQAQAVYLGSDWATTLSSQTSPFDGFLQATVAGTYMDMLGTAGFTGPNHALVGRGSDTAGVVDPINLPVTNLQNYNNSNPLSSPNYNPLFDSQIRADLQSAITSGLVQQPNANTLYVIFVADNVVVDQGNGANSINSFFAYHSSFTGTNGAPVRYSVTPYHGSNGFLNNSGYANAQESWLSTFDSMTLATSHELAEAVTDPDGTAWYDGPDNAEVGDLDVASTVYLNGYAVQRESALPGSPSNFVGMTPVGATAGHPVAFSLQQGGALYEYGSNSTSPILIATGVAAISDQGIDAFGQPMIDYVRTTGYAYEYHDFLSSSALLTQNANVLPLTPLGPNVKQARAGQGVSYVLLTNGQLGEYVDPNFATRYGYNANPTPHHNGVIATGVSSIDAGTDKFGVNSVDYTITVRGTTYLYQWDDATDQSTLLASGVTAFSAGQHGTHAYVSKGTAYLYTEATGLLSAVVNPPLSGPATSVVLGVGPSGAYQLVVLYSSGAAYQYSNTTTTGTSLGTNVRAVSKTFNGVFRVLLTTGVAYELPGNTWIDANDIAVA